MPLSFTDQMSEAITIPAAAVPPANRASSTVPLTVGPVDMSKIRRVMGWAMCGVLTGAANVQAYFQTCSVSNGTFANITNGNTLTLSANNTQGTLEIRADQLPVGDRYLQLCVLNNSNAAFCAGTVFGAVANYEPAAQQDAASISRLVSNI